MSVSNIFEPWFLPAGVCVCVFLSHLRILMTRHHLSSARSVDANTVEVRGHVLSHRHGVSPGAA